MPNFAEEPESIVIEHKRDIKERSDFDRDQTVNREKLGEDWGDGFHVETEPVLVNRGPDGEIVSLVPMHEAELQREKELEEAEEVPPVVAPTITALEPVGPREREKIVRIMAVRLFKEYAQRSPEDNRYNPIYDGIPDVPPGSPQNLQPIPGTKMYPASNDQILEWLKTTVIGSRAKVINRKIGEGYRPSLTIDRSV